MTFNLLAFSIGNTRTRMGTFVDGKLAGSLAISHADPDEFAAAVAEAHAPLSGRSDAVAVFGSVQPRITERLRRIVPEHTGLELLRVEEDLPIPIGRKLDREALVGDDRLLNAAAAYHTLKQSCIVVDAGTAMTVDLIDGEGTFHGGAILPGAQMMLDALGRQAAQLPDLEIARPDEAVGHNTNEAMLTGVFHALRGAVRELSEQYAEAAGHFPMIIATGGNADLLFSGWELVERIVPDLTLLGVAVTFQVSRSAADG
ncbi:MAG: type III pantothenate kinase [Phycisphaeraceae bacterium]|nr:type III pantothenate kinase [Phycisphaeraceae bacterium]